MCGGVYEYWQTPKQLVKIHGETLIERTVRLLQENGVNKRDIAVSVSNGMQARKILDTISIPLSIYVHKNQFTVSKPETVSSGYWCECFYPCSIPCTYLMGDVVFSPEAIKKIVETPTDDIEFFASAPPFAKNYSKPWAEPFAFKVFKQEHLHEAQRTVMKLCDEKKFHRHPIAWELWQVIKETPINVIDYTNYTVINDYTCDIDKPEDIKKFEGAEL